jgi:hypothetical protein
MQKSLLLILVLIFVLSFSGCGLLSPKPSETEEPSASPLVTEAPEESPDPSPEESQPAETEPVSEPTPQPDGFITVNTGSGELQVEAANFKGTLQSSPLLKFNVFIDTAKYEESKKASVFRYISKEDESGNTFLEISFAADTTAAELSPTIMSSYFDFTTIEFASYSKIGSDKLRASTILANNDSREMEVYLIDVTGGVVVAALSTMSEYSDAALPYLHAMLDTLTLE